jgi:hypothetical protein
VKDTRALRAWGSLGGLLFVVLFVAGSALIFDGPSGDESPAKYLSFYGDSGHRDRINIGWILAGLGLFFFVWFVAALRETVRETEARALGRDGMLGYLITVGGSAYAAVTMGAVGLAAGVRTMSDDTYHHEVYPGVLHAFNDGTYIMHATGTAALASLIFAFSFVILSYGVLPRWLGWFGLLAGVAALVSLLFFTMIIWLLWIAVTSLILFMQARRAAPETGAHAAAV